jgi:hypothetical protein
MPILDIKRREEKNKFRMYGAALCTDSSMLFSSLDPNVIVGNFQSEARTHPSTSTGQPKSISATRQRKGVARPATSDRLSKKLSSFQSSSFQNTTFEYTEGIFTILPKLLSCMRVSGVSCRDLMSHMSRVVEERGCLGFNPLSNCGVSLSEEVGGVSTWIRKIAVFNINLRLYVTSI